MSQPAASVSRLTKALARSGILLLGFGMASCAPFISAKPSNLSLITQETHTLAPSQVSQLKSRLGGFADGNGLALAVSGAPGDGSPFSLELRDKGKVTSVIVTSPFKPSDFVFGLYSGLKEPGRIASQKALFTKAVQIATAP